MKQFFIIVLFISSVSAFANCRKEVISAAINYRASGVPTNVDFVGEAMLLAQRGEKLYYFVQVDVHQDSAAEDVSSWIVKVVAEQSGDTCRVLEITR